MRRLLLLAACGSALLVPAAAQAAGVVEGTVTPLAWAREVEVCLIEGRPSETCTTPAADGSYALDEVPLGGARVEFVPSFRSRLLRQYYNGVTKLAEATAIVLAPSSPTAKGINANLVEGGAISGTVTAAAGGQPLSEVEVCAVSTGSPTVKSCGETDAAGEYELHSLPTENYRVGFWGTGRSAEYEPWSHPIVAVTAGSTTVGVVASLAKGGQIRGVLTAAAAGVRLADISVCLFAVAGSKPQRCTYSDEAGEYGFVGLPGGSYQVGFSLDSAELGGQGGSGEDGFESQYYDRVDSRAEAAAIPLIAPALVDGIDAALVTPPAPVAVVPAPPVASPIVPAPPAVSEPKPKKAACKKPKRKRKVKGKVRCVKRPVRKHKGRKAKKGHPGRARESYPARG